MIGRDKMFLPVFSLSSAARHFLDSVQESGSKERTFYKNSHIHFSQVTTEDRLGG